MKMTTCSVGGREFFLRLSVDAKFDLDEITGNNYGSIWDDGKDAWDKTVRCFCVLASCGERIRRAMHYDPGILPDETFIRHTALLTDQIPMKNAISAAIVQGFGEGRGEEDEDPWLAEIEAANPEKHSMAELIRLGLKAGLSMRETLDAEPALILGLLDLEHPKGGAE